MRSRIAIAAPWLCAVSSVGLAIDLETAEVAVRADLGRALDAGESLQREILIEPAAEIGLSDSAGLTVSARLRADAMEKLEPGKPALGTYSRQSRPATLGTAGTAELRDFYVEAELGSVYLRAGKQQLVWGSLDGFKILDAMNPQSFREFILDDFDDSRISLWTLSVEVPLGATLLQLAWLPDPTVHQLPTDEAFFAFRAPRFRYGSDPETPSPAHVVVDRPDDIWRDGGFGLRMAGFTGGWDWSLVALSGLDPAPHGVVSQSDGRVMFNQRYRRRQLFGFSLARSFGNVALRGEAAVQPERRFNTRNAAGRLAVVRHDQVSAAIAADIDAPGGLFLNAQVLVDHVRGAEPNLVRPSTDWLFTVFVRKTFRYDTVTAAIKWYASLSDGDGVLRPEIRYGVTDAVSLALGVDLFHGDDTGIFGQFADRDRLTLSFEVTL